MNKFARQSETILKQGIEMLTEKSELLVKANALLQDQVMDLMNEVEGLNQTIARLQERIRSERDELE